MKWILYNAQHRALFLAGAILTLFTSCESIFEDKGNTAECATQYRVRFKYDYNMKFTNAFANEVNTVTLYAFDENGRFVYQRTEDGDRLKDDDYSMRIDMEPGEYDLITWAGLDQNSFAVPLLVPGVSTKESLNVKTNRRKQSRAVGEDAGIVSDKLQPLWHGNVTKVATRNENQELITIPLVKNTNSIRIILQQMQGQKLDVNQFDFAIKDDNGWMNYDNGLLADDTLTYKPYLVAQGTTDMGNLEGDVEFPEISVVVAQITTGRLMADKEPYLYIKNKETGKNILVIPLVQYLMLTAQEGHNMTPQEYFDRQDQYALTFFLDGKLEWINAQIIINGWVIRPNDADL